MSSRIIQQCFDLSKNQKSGVLALSQLLRATAKSGKSLAYQQQQQRRHFTVNRGSPLFDSFNVQDEQDFQDKVLANTTKPIVVEFHATWCGPCKLLMPRLEKRIGITKNAVDLAKVDIDDHPDLAMNYGVGAVPSVLVFKDGKIIEKFVGLKDDDEIDVFVKKLLPKS